MMFQIKNIQYDTDGELVDLPETFEVDANVVYEKGQVDPDDEQGIEDFLSDYISDQTGFCHFGFEIVKNT